MEITVQKFFGKEAMGFELADSGMSLVCLICGENTENFLYISDKIPFCRVSREEIK